MIRSVCLVSCAVMLWPLAGEAQQLTGLAAWTVGSSTSESDSQSNDNRSFSQEYVLGLATPLVDPRLLRLNLEGAFRTSGLSFGGTAPDRKGDQRNIGYKVGAAFFPQRPFPLTILMTRDNIDESGQFPSSSVIRGGLVNTPDQIAPAFQLVNRSTNVTWQLNSERLPRVDLSYASGTSETIGSAYSASQRQGTLHAGLTKETTRLRHAFRFDRNAIDNLIRSSHRQRLNQLDYEFAARLSARSRFNVHLGRRRSYSLFDVPSQVVDPGAGDVNVPARGESSTRYLISTLTLVPFSRLSLEATGSLQRQTTEVAATGARLLLGGARFDVGRGLYLTADGTYGTRQQVVASRVVDVVTRFVQAGASYRTGPRWFQLNAGGSRGVGSNRQPDGMRGDTGRWSAQAGLSSTVRAFTVSAGRERSRARDTILDFGNTAIDRTRAAVQFQPGRLLLSANWEDSVIDRGRDATFSTLWQRTGSGSISWRLGRTFLLTGNGGAFTSIGESGTDLTRFVGAEVEAAPVGALRVSGWIRREGVTSSLTGLDQQGFAWFGRAEYRLRELTIALEYRNTNQDFRLGPSSDGYMFHGRQILFRALRRVNIPL